MNAVDFCPHCGTYLNYDGDLKEWYCSCCDYSEFEQFKTLKKFRKELD